VGGCPRKNMGKLLSRMNGKYMIWDETFFIKEGYLPNKKNFTLEDDHFTYWTDKRIGNSVFYQYYVYLIARLIAKIYYADTIIDIGCGPGVKTLKMLKPLAQRLVGVDQESAINICKQQNTDAEFYVANLEDLQENLDALNMRSKFSLVVCADVIEHMQNPDNLLRYIREVANDKAWILISTPERDLLRGKDCLTPENPSHIREWNRFELKKYLENRGFNVIRQFCVPDQKIRLEKKYIKLFCQNLKQGRNINTCQVAICKIATNYLAY
jgi:predicted TPR repeat methyltransferase